MPMLSINGKKLKIAGSRYRFIKTVARHKMTGQECSTGVLFIVSLIVETAIEWAGTCRLSVA
jgi:hypothetical protein